MPWSAVICTALIMAFFVRDYSCSINIKPVLPFSDKFLKHVADFDDVDELRYLNALNANPGKEEQNLLEDAKVLKCAECGKGNQGSHDDAEKTKPNDANDNNYFKEDEHKEGIKRGLSDVGQYYAENYFGSSFEKYNPNDREERANAKSKEETKLTSNDGGCDEDDKGCDNKSQDDKDISKIEASMKEDNGRNKKNSVPFNKRDFGSGNFLNMYFYEPKNELMSETGGNLRENENSLSVKLYPEETSHKSNVELPNKFQYIALVADGAKLRPVPAIKLKMAFTDDLEYHYKPLFFTRYKRQASQQPEAKSISDIMKFITGQKITPIPILFINTASQHESKITKRASVDEAENKYLQAANSLIQSLKASLDLQSSDVTTGRSSDVINPDLINAGILIYPRLEDLNLDNKLTESLSTTPSYNFGNLLKYDQPVGFFEDKSALIQGKNVPKENRLVDKITANPLQRFTDINNANILNLLKNVEILKNTDRLLAVTNNDLIADMPLLTVQLSPTNSPLSVTADSPQQTQELSSTSSTFPSTAEFAVVNRAVPLVPSSSAKVEIETPAPSESACATYEDDGKDVLDLLQTSTSATEIATSNSNNTNTPKSVGNNKTENVSVPTIMSILSPTTATHTIATQPSIKSKLVNKLENLEKDLRLVYEVQNILGGLKNHGAKTARRKRDVSDKHVFKKSCRHHKMSSSTRKPDIAKELAGLGKIMKWMEQESNTECKELADHSNHRKHQHVRKRRKSRKPWDTDSAHFLG